MIGTLIFFGLLTLVCGGIWLFDRYVQARGGDEWHWYW